MLHKFNIQMLHKFWHSLQ